MLEILGIYLLGVIIARIVFRIMHRSTDIVDEVEASVAPLLSWFSIVLLLVIWVVVSIGRWTDKIIDRLFYGKSRMY